MRLPAFAKGTRVLLADQWIQTGGTMEAAIQLVERQGGIVAGLVTIAMENCEATDAYAKRFPIVTAVVPGSQWQTECNAQDLSSFRSYKAERTFPTAGRTAP